MGEDFGPAPVAQRLAREVNDRILELADGWGGRCSFICECRDSGCVLRVEMPREEFVRIRGAEGTPYIVVRGCPFEVDESLVQERHAEYRVVRPQRAAATSMHAGSPGRPER